MTRTFIHNFDPPADSPVTGSTVALTVEEIENAGIKEVLQTPGAALGTWRVLDGLLEPTGDGSPFLFREPLGQSREVKVALSGLFGRFVARAYLERYLGLSVYAHLTRRSVVLHGRRRLHVVRLEEGDFPDWIAWGANDSDPTIVEAKGCHDSGGPEKALSRAWAQVHRVAIMAGDRRVTVKRVAVATRWGSGQGGAKDARLFVRDPVEEGEPIEPEDKDSLFIGVLRLHVANLLEPLGYPEFAARLRQLIAARFAANESAAQVQLRQLFDGMPVSEVENATAAPVPGDPLVGGVVTRAGPLGGAIPSDADQQTLSRLALRPVFVGIERGMVAAAIEGDVLEARGRLAGPDHADAATRRDRSGTWIVPLDGTTIRTI